MKFIRYVYIFCLAGIMPVASCCQTVDATEQQLEIYRKSLDSIRLEWPNRRDMPATKFFLFGMGDRPKMIYSNGILKNAKTGEILKQWTVSKEIIIPSEYTVTLITSTDNRIKISENGEGVFIEDAGGKDYICRSKIHLPSFTGYRYAPVLRVLLHEVLINIVEGMPVPNFFVYKRPWYRDAALMGMVLKQTKNLHLVKDWILKIRDPFDRNNHGTSEADNLGEVLYLISLVSDSSHPAVNIILDSVKQFEKEGYIEGKTDYALHPVFQTKWLKYGLRSLGLPDNYRIPEVYDSYSSLFWWDYKDHHVEGRRHDAGGSYNWPYLVWAEDHFFGERKGILTNREYPLSWESNASDANYEGLKILDPELAAAKLSPPHTWHAAEMFLMLSEKKTN